MTAKQVTFKRLALSSLTTVPEFKFLQGGELSDLDSQFPVDNFGTDVVVGENPDCLLLSGTVVSENPDHVCWVLV